jgi:CheY-like chemotaxis protein
VAPLGGGLLVVEDDPAIRGLIAEAIAWELGIRVGLARDGEEALERAAALRPAVVVLDINMPRLDGYEVARRLKRGASPPWIIAVSAVSDPAPALAAGCDVFVAKPFDLNVLLMAVASALWPGGAARRARPPHRRPAAGRPAARLDGTGRRSATQAECLSVLAIASQTRR